MVSFTSMPKRILAVALSLTFLSSCIHKKYETPITKNTQQPDKILFDSAMHDIERGRYEVARISLQTLMNTYESSEFLAKAKLAIADSWFREGGSNGLAQAEAEYKDFQLFYPAMEESAQAQKRVCDIHYKQMDKSDRDIVQTLRAETECKALITQYPNSKFVPDTTQELRDIQESLAAHEMTVGDYYWRHQMNPAAANRLNALVDQYPLFSGSPDALYEAGDAYSKMGPRFRKTAGEMFSRIVSDYPLSARVKDAKKRLEDMEMPIPAVNQASLERAKWEQENAKRAGVVHKSMAWVRSAPDLSHSAQSGAPTMTDPKRTMPASIPVVNPVPEAAATPGAATTGVNNVTADTTTGTGLEKSEGKEAAPQALPTNRDKELEQLRAKQKKLQEKASKKKPKKKPEETTPPSAPATPAAATPASTTTAPATTPQS